MNQVVCIHKCVTVKLKEFQLFCVFHWEAEYFDILEDVGLFHHCLVSLRLLPTKVVAEAAILSLKVLFCVQLN